MSKTIKLGLIEIGGNHSRDKGGFFSSFAALAVMRTLCSKIPSITRVIDSKFGLDNLYIPKIPNLRHASCLWICRAEKYIASSSTCVQPLSRRN